MVSTGPTAVPTTQAVKPADPGSGATVRYYTAAIDQTSVAAALSQAFVVRIYNCATSVSACGTSETTSTQHMKSATVVVPAGFTGVSGISASASAGKTWTATLVAGTLQLVSVSGDTNALLPGEYVEVHFSATAPSTCGTYEFTTTGYNGTDFTTPYTRVGSQPTVEVTGCTISNSCTLTQGYWKNHDSAWPATSLTLGTVLYTKGQLLSILNTAPAGNGLLALAHQLIAARLNEAAGADMAALGTAMDDADTLIGALEVPPVGDGFLAPAATSALTATLDSFNKGLTGPGHCGGTETE